MIYKLIVNLGFLALGYYVGREVGRTEEVRERMAHARRTGQSMNFRDAVTIDMEKAPGNGDPGPVKH